MPCFLQPSQSPTGNQQNNHAHICAQALIETDILGLAFPCFPLLDVSYSSLQTISNGIPGDPWFLTAASTGKAGDFSGNLYMERETQGWTEIDKREGYGEKAVRRQKPRWDCSVTSCPSPTTVSVTVHSILLSQTEETHMIQWSHLSTGHIKLLNCSP